MALIVSAAMPDARVRFPGALGSAGRRHGVAILTLVMLGFAIYWPVLTYQPHDADNLIALSIAAASAPWHFLTDNFVSYLPGYRPFAYLTLWSQYHLLGYDVGQLFSFNVLALVASALGAYALVVVATGLRLIGIAAAALLLLDSRVLSAVYWLGERQSTLACALGALALAIAIRAGLLGRLERKTAVVIFVLVLLAAGSKEFGIAFAAGIMVTALLGRPEQRKTLLVASVTPVVVYLVVRAALAGLSLSDYCETMGFLNHPSEMVCYGDLDSRGMLGQQGWNMVATFLGTFFPSAFSGEGSLLVSPSAFGTTIPWSSLIVPAITLGFAAVCMLRRPRLGLVLLAVIVANGVLNLALYRQRNQLAGIVALDAAAGIGLAELALAYGRRVGAGWKMAFGVGATIAVVWAGSSAVRRNEDLTAVRDNVARLDPCMAAREYPRDITPAVVVEVKQRLDVSNQSRC